MLYHENSQHVRVMQLKYKAKYKKMKQEIKNMVLENASLADEVAQIQADLYTAREERRYLAKRLLRHGEDAAETANTANTTTATPTMPPTTTISGETTTNMPKKRGPKKRAPNSNKQEKKKLKSTRVKLDGNYSIIIHSIGEIIPINPNFHTDSTIYPVGYVASRVYAHPKNPYRRCVYTCKILNNAGKPQFQIIPDNDLDSVYFGETADFCHQQLLEQLMQHGLTEIQPTMPLSLNVQGDRFFGLCHSMVKSLLQRDPSFGQCAHFQGFSNQDANNLALAEDKDPSLSFDALQKALAPPTSTATPTAAFHMKMPEVKDFPPDELLNFN